MNYFHLWADQRVTFSTGWVGLSHSTSPVSSSHLLIVEPIVVFCKIINAHDGDHDEDDIDDCDEVLPVHTNQRQIIDTSVGLLVTAAPSITIAA